MVKDAQRGADGITAAHTNGANQCGVKKSSEADVYNTVMKNFLATMKQIDEMIRQSKPEEGGDELMGFLAGH